MISVRVRGSTAANFWVGSLGFLVPSTLTKLSPDLASNNTCSLSLSPCQCTTTGAQTVSYYVVVEGGSAQFTKWQKHSKYSYAYHYCEFETTIKQKLPSKATPREQKREQNIGNKTQKKQKNNHLPPCYLAITIFIIISLEPICLHTLFTWIKNNPIKDVLISLTN